MVVDELDVVGIASGPPETETPLVVDANAVLPVSIVLELLEAIPRRNPEILKPHRRVDVAELAEHDAAEVWRKAAHVLARPQALGVTVGEVLDHPSIVTRCVTKRKSPVQVQITELGSAARHSPSAAQ